MNNNNYNKITLSTYLRRKIFKLLYKTLLGKEKWSKFS